MTPASPAVLTLVMPPKPEMMCSRLGTAGNEIGQPDRRQLDLQRLQALAGSVDEDLALPATAWSCKVGGGAYMEVGGGEINALQPLCFYPHAAGPRTRKD
jgi:hypothetical protein